MHCTLNKVPELPLLFPRLVASRDVHDTQKKARLGYPLLLPKQTGVNKK